MFESIMIHLSFLDKLLDQSEKIIVSLKNEDIQGTLFLVNNRARLIKIIKALEKKINTNLKERHYKDDNLSEIYQSWKLDSEILAKKVFYLDQFSFEYLSKIKKETKQKISEVFVLNRFHSAYLTNSIEF